MQKSQKTDDLSRSPNRTMLRRTLFLMAVCGILAFLALAARLYILQIRDHEKYEDLAISQQLRETGASASRGTIYDRNNRHRYPGQGDSDRADKISWRETNSYRLSVCPFGAFRLFLSW